MSSDHVSHVDHCSCWKPPGGYSQEGWHLQQLDVEGAMQLWLSRDLDEFERRNHRKPNPTEHARMVEIAKQDSKPYVGTVVALEECPLYRRRRMGQPAAVQATAPPPDARPAAQESLL